MLSLFSSFPAFLIPIHHVAPMTRWARSSPPVTMMAETGTAMRWNEERGFGFISPDSGGDDIFCHFSAIEDGRMLQEGAKVSFVKGFDDRSGKERAEQVTGGAEAPRSSRGGGTPGEVLGGVTGDPPAGMVAGTAKRWTEKGFGFISPDEGGDDLFCHFSAITDGNALSEGARVHYVKEFDASRGNDRAAQVIGGFQEEYRGKGGGRGRADNEEERRMDADGSGPFTKREFLSFYGNYAAWDAAA